MISFIQKSSLLLIAPILFSSCGSNPEPKPVKPTPVAKVNPAATSTAKLAQRILKHPKIILMKRQVSGRVDGASSYDNIASVARGYSAKRSSYGTAPGGYVKLRRQMLETMLYLADVKGYSYSVSSIAGGSHSRTSRHYAGLGFDINRINGKRVNSSNPHYRNIMRIARQKGATEVLGPGHKGHSSHIHLAWPR